MLLDANKRSTADLETRAPRLSWARGLAFFVGVCLASATAFTLEIVGFFWGSALGFLHDRTLQRDMTFLGALVFGAAGSLISFSARMTILPQMRRFPFLAIATATAWCIAGALGSAFWSGLFFWFGAPSMGAVTAVVFLGIASKGSSHAT